MEDNNVLFARQYMLIRAVKLPIIPNNNETAERKSNMWIGLTFDDLNNGLNFICLIHLYSRHEEVIFQVTNNV